MSASCRYCTKEIVAEVEGYRSDERDMTVDRVRCEDGPNNRHEPAMRIDLYTYEVSPPWRHSERGDGHEPPTP